MTRLFATIITDDKRFARMLALELSSRGVELVDGGSASSSEMKHGRRFYIVDLDFCAEYAPTHALRRNRWPLPYIASTTEKNTNCFFRYNCRNDAPLR